MIYNENWRSFFHILTHIWPFVSLGFLWTAPFLLNYALPWPNLHLPYRSTFLFTSLFEHRKSSFKLTCLPSLDIGPYICLTALMYSPLTASDRVRFSLINRIISAHALISLYLYDIFFTFVLTSTLHPIYMSLGARSSTRSSQVGGTLGREATNLSARSAFTFARPRGPKKLILPHLFWDELVL